MPETFSMKPHGAALQPFEKESLMILWMMGKRFIKYHRACAEDRGRLHEEQWDQDPKKIDVLFEMELFSDDFAGISMPGKQGIRKPEHFVRALSNYNVFYWPAFRTWIEERGHDYPDILKFFAAVNYGRLFILRHYQDYEGVERGPLYAARYLNALTLEKSLPLATPEELAEEVPAARAHLTDMMHRLPMEPITADPTLSGQQLPAFDTTGQLQMHDFANDTLVRHVQSRVLNQRTKHWDEGSFAMYGPNGYDRRKASRTYGIHQEMEVPYEPLDYLLLACAEYRYRYGL